MRQSLLIVVYKLNIYFIDPASLFTTAEQEKQLRVFFGLMHSSIKTCKKTVHVLCTVSRVEITESIAFLKDQ